jgi:nucleoside-diphosphate-sugar epimerase
MDGALPQAPGNVYALSKCFAEQQLQYFVKYHSLASATAIRFPMLVPRKWLADMKAHMQGPVHIHPHTPMEEAFTWLTTDDAGQLIADVVKTDLPGYR